MDATIFSDFCKNLKGGLCKNVKFATECLIRHDFIKTYGAKYGFEDVEIEVPYVSKKDSRNQIKIKKDNNSDGINTRNRADLYIGGSEDTVIEFKYHKKDKRSNPCLATNMGESFRDLNRLSLTENKEKFFIYVFDEKFKDYYSKNAIDLLKYDNIKSGDKFSVGRDLDSITSADGYAEFKKNALSSFGEDSKFEDFSYNIEVCYKCYCDGLYVLIYKVC